MRRSRSASEQVPDHDQRYPETSHEKENSGQDFSRNYKAARKIDSPKLRLLLAAVTIRIRPDIARRLTEKPSIARPGIAIPLHEFPAVPRARGRRLMMQRLAEHVGAEFIPIGARI